MPTATARCALTDRLLEHDLHPTRLDELGYDPDGDELAALTPTLFEHVNPLGTYDFSTDRPAGQLRPLDQRPPPEVRLTRFADFARLYVAPVPLGPGISQTIALRP